MLTKCGYNLSDFHQQIHKMHSVSQPNVYVLHFDVSQIILSALVPITRLSYFARYKIDEPIEKRLQFSNKQQKTPEINQNKKN